jgi:hypothetical protein
MCCRGPKTDWPHKTDDHLKAVDRFDRSDCIKQKNLFSRDTTSQPFLDSQTVGRMVFNLLEDYFVLIPQDFHLAGHVRGFVTRLLCADDFKILI